VSLRAIVVDDEPLAVRRLQIALERIGGIQLLGTASDGLQAKELIDTHSTDLIFLDIRMPIMDGFGLVKALSSGHVPEIIFVTAYRDFAVAAFEAGAVGYVLKPNDDDRLRVAVDRARMKLQARNADERLAALLVLLSKLQKVESDSKPPFERELWLTSGHKMERVAVEDIDWFETAGDYVAVHRGGREYLLHGSLRSLAERLDPAEFARVHRKALVRLKAVDAVERTNWGGLVLAMTCGDRVAVSRTYKGVMRSKIMTRSANLPPGDRLVSD
jgi:DNA-binding LytR/AlgR family response regulator